MINNVFQFMNNNKIDVILFNKVVYQRYNSELIGLIEYSFLCCIISCSGPTGIFEKREKERGCRQTLNYV